MNERWDINQLASVRDKEVYSADGKKVGSIKDIYYDDNSGEPEWIGVGMGFLGLKERLVPVGQMITWGARVLVPYTKDKIQNEPDFDIRDEHIVDEDETRLCDYFSIAATHGHSPRVLRYGEDYGGTQR